MFEDELARVLNESHTNREGRITIESLESTYSAWRMYSTEYGKAMVKKYTEEVSIMFKILVKEKRIPSVYRMKALRKYVADKDYYTEGIEHDVLKNMLSQVDQSLHIFDHEDITDDDTEAALKELVTYNIKDADASSAWGSESIPHKEDADAITERDFMHFMAFR